MCAPGNQSIYRECRDAVMKSKGGMRQADMRKVIAEHGGCMVKSIDKSSK